MKTIDQLNKLKELNLYSNLVKSGIIPISVNSSFEIFNYYNLRMIVNKEFNNCKTKSYEQTCEKFNISEMTVRRAINFMSN